MKLIDNFGRVHNYLRISLTDRCNYNCIYCNPNNSVFFNGKDSLLSFEELFRLIELFAREFGFGKFRFTGGEPLARNGVFDFFNQLKKLKYSYGFASGLTTNGSLLRGHARRLKESGIDRLNISLDSLNREKFKLITNRDDLQKILGVIDECLDAGFDPLKINAVIIKNTNDNELIDFVDYFKNKNVNIRFIEFMPFGGNGWGKDDFIDYREMKSRIEEHFSMQPLSPAPNAIAKDFQLVNYRAKVSFITSLSEHFCSGCSRLRVSSQGNLRLCLFSNGESGLNFKQLFRRGFSDKEIAAKISEAVRAKWEKHPDIEELADLSVNNMMTIGG